MADYYDQLSSTDQGTFRATLFAVMSPGACPTVDVAGINSPDALNDAANRGIAIDCVQTALQVGASPGVLDQATYNAIMNPAAPKQPAGWSTQTKVIVGASAIGGAALLWWLLSRKPHRRANPLSFLEAPRKKKRTQRITSVQYQPSGYGHPKGWYYGIVDSSGRVRNIYGFGSKASATRAARGNSQAF